MKNHATSWGTAANPHIRAQVWAHLRDEGIGPTASGASVVGALDQAYGLSASTVRSFCN